MMSERDHVIGAITTLKRPLTLKEIFESCDCFEFKTDVAKLVNSMLDERELVSFRLDGEPARYGTPGMSFATPTVKAAKQALAKSVIVNDEGTPPNKEETAHARRDAPLSAVRIGPFDMDAVHKGQRREIFIRETTPATDVKPVASEALLIGAHHRVVPLEQQDARDTDEVLTLLRAHLSEDEFRGYCRGNLIALSLRGRPEDLKRQSVFGQALAGAA